MRATAKNYVPAVACALTPLLCYFAVRPFAEIGIVDDWSYIKTAQVLVQTGHIAYNGWATAMLGWQVYFGALFIKVFGFSFTAVRFATVIESVTTAFLLQRTFVRAGVNDWNATVATMTFIVSPLCFPLEFTFMTDISGVLCIVVCFYMCLRALEAKSELSAIVCISLAALLNAVGGTARQIAWLGVLVMVPSALWLLRRNRRVLVVGCLACIAGACIAAAAIVWFARQPYTLPVYPLHSKPGLESLEILGETALCAAGQLMLLALPVLLMFVATLRWWNHRIAVVFLSGLVCIVVAGIALFQAGSLGTWLAPFVDDYMTDTALDKLSAIGSSGIHLSAAPDILRVLLTGSLILGLFCLITCLIAGGNVRREPQNADTTISWQKLGFVLGPFSLAYLFILISTMLQYRIFFDRYLAPLLAILLLVLARFYQERVGGNLSAACVLFIAIFAAFSVAATHDFFALYRGYVSAIGQIESTGTPATAILGPWEFDAWNQVELVGYINERRIHVPKETWISPPVRSLPPNCDTSSTEFLDKTPAINPIYAIILDPTQCGGQVAFPPVMYKTWIAPHINLVYTMKLPVLLSPTK